MKCDNCQFHLLCHAGRLDSWSEDSLSLVLLCPECNRLSVGQHETLYIFSCEKRQLSQGHQEVFKHLCTEGLSSAAMSAQVPDMGPGLIGKLTVASCAACLDMLPPQIRGITLKYLDENREENLAERVKEIRKEAIAAEEFDE